MEIGGEKIVNLGLFLGQAGLKILPFVIGKVGLQQTLVAIDVASPPSNSSYLLLIRHVPSLSMW
jgi:hypothetical protein